jgi:hypothetical protein
MRVGMLVPTAAPWRAQLASQARARARGIMSYFMSWPGNLSDSPKACSATGLVCDGLDSAWCSCGSLTREPRDLPNKLGSKAAASPIHDAPIRKP